MVKENIENTSPGGLETNVTENGEVSNAKGSGSSGELKEGSDRNNSSTPGPSKSRIASLKCSDLDSAKMEKIGSEAESFGETIYACTICDANLMIRSRKLHPHPLLDVLLCKNCLCMYNHAKFPKDESGYDEYCRWCGLDGDLICCDFCTNAFHQDCIKKNVSKEDFDKLSFNDKWACVVCDATAIKNAQETCRKVMKFMDDAYPKDNLSMKKTRKSYLSPNEKMLPKVAMSRCIENVNGCAKSLKDILTIYRKKLSSCESLDDIKYVGEKLKNSLKVANDNHNDIIKSIDKIFENVAKDIEQAPSAVSVTVASASATNKDDARTTVSVNMARVDKSLSTTNVCNVPSSVNNVTSATDRLSGDEQLAANDLNSDNSETNRITRQNKLSSAKCGSGSRAAGHKKIIKSEKIEISDIEMLENENSDIEKADDVDEKADKIAIEDILNNEMEVDGEEEKADKKATRNAYVDKKQSDAVNDEDDISDNAGSDETSGMSTPSIPEIKTNENKKAKTKKSKVKVDAKRSVKKKEKVPSEDGTDSTMILGDSVKSESGDTENISNDEAKLTPRDKQLKLNTSSDETESDLKDPVPKKKSREISKSKQKSKIEGKAESKGEEKQIKDDSEEEIEKPKAQDEKKRHLKGEEEKEEPKAKDGKKRHLKGDEEKEEPKAKDGKKRHLKGDEEKEEPKAKDGKKRHLKGDEEKEEPKAKDGKKRHLKGDEEKEEPKAKDEKKRHLKGDKEKEEPKVKDEEKQHFKSDEEKEEPKAKGEKKRHFKSDEEKEEPKAKGEKKRHFKSDEEKEEPKAKGEKKRHFKSDEEKEEPNAKGEKKRHFKGSKEKREAHDKKQDSGDDERTENSDENFEDFKYDPPVVSVGDITPQWGDLALDLDNLIDTTPSDDISKKVSSDDSVKKDSSPVLGDESEPEASEKIETKKKSSKSNDACENSVKEDDSSSENRKADNERLKVTPLRLSLKNISPKKTENDQKPKNPASDISKNRNRTLQFASDSESFDESDVVKKTGDECEKEAVADSKAGIVKESSSDEEKMVTSEVDDSDLKAKQKLLKTLADSEETEDEISNKSRKEKKSKRRKNVQPSNKTKTEKPVAKSDEEEAIPKNPKVKYTINKKRQLERLLNESEKSPPSLNDLDSGKPRLKITIKKSSPSSSGAQGDDDPKLKMNLKVTVKRIRQQVINFMLNHGYKAWRKSLRTKNDVNSSDEEFMKLCDIGFLRNKKRPKPACKKMLDSSDDEDSTASKVRANKLAVKADAKIKKKKDSLASDSSESSESEKHAEEDEDEDRPVPAKTRLASSSDSEPVFKSANELAKERLLASSSGEDDENETDGGDDDDDDDDDDEGSLKNNKSKRKKGAEKSKNRESKTATKFDSDDDFVIGNKSKRTRSKLSKNILSDSDSNDSFKMSKRKRKGKGKDSETGKMSTSSATSVGSRKRKLKGGKKGTKKKRRRIKMASSSDSSVEEVSDDDLKSTPSGKGRKNIRKVISDRKLTSDTKMAAREEDERKKRVAELQKLYNEVKDVGNDDGKPVTTKLVLASSKDETLKIAERLICKLKPHQVEGVKFMWECLGETLDRLDETSGSGCILAHCMGLGKTLQVITFLHTMLTRDKGFPNTALVVCPLSTVLNWYRECDMWLEDVHPSILVLEMSSVKSHRERLMVLNNWNKDGGILIMGYDNFRNLVQENSKRIPKFYREQFQKYLIDPGPDIVVCDEGHILKNFTTGISKAMTRIATRRRIILTGTPLQNNLTEYHCMVSFVKPSLLGTMKEFQNRFVNPISNGQHNDSTPSDVRVMKSRAHILHNLLDGCVQRRDYNVLTPFLPPKYEYVISVRLTEVQVQLYSYYLNNLCSRLHGKGYLFGDYQSLMKIWTHPRVIRLAEIRQESKANNESNDSFIDDNSYSSSSESKHSVILEESDEPGTSNKKSARDSDTEVVNRWKTRSRSEKMTEDIQEIVKDDISDGPLTTWWSSIISEEDAKKVEHSGKLLVLFEILKQCDEIGDKVLLFSQSLLSLDFIESIITGSESVEGANLPPFVGKMVHGIDYFRLDGSTNADLRSKFIQSFNEQESHKARLFLISTKAGSLGINLVSANRVVIFDASWNPTHDIQSIFRVYRFGQTKPVYVYRLVSHGTMEEKIYDRQVTKQSLACRVIDEQQIERHFSFADLQELYSFQPDNVRNRPTPMVPKDKLLADLLNKQKDLIMSYHEHDSLLVNQAEEELTEEERRAAWVEYNFERQALNTEGVRLDIHTTIQHIQEQNPGLSIQELMKKLSDTYEAVIADAREKRLQKQQLMQLHLQQQQQQQLQQQQQRMQAQMQFTPQLNYAYQNQAQEMFGARPYGHMDFNRQYQHLARLPAPKPNVMNPAFGKVGSMAPEKPFQ